MPFFNQNYTVSGPLNDLAKISDLKSKISINYLIKDGRFVKMCEFRMYEDFRKAGEIIDFKIDKKDTKYIGGVEGYKVEYKEKIDNLTKIIKMYVGKNIKYPIKMFVNFPDDLKICPIYIEEYYESTPRNKTIRKLYSVKEVPEIVIDHKRKKIIGEKIIDMLLKIYRYEAK